MGRYRIRLVKTIAISGSIERKGSRNDTKVYVPDTSREMPRITASDKIAYKSEPWDLNASGGTDVADVGFRKPTLHRASRLHGRAGAGGGGGGALTGSENGAGFRK